MSENGTAPFMAALSARACEALVHWGLGAQTPQLLKYRENAVFRISLENGEPAALRLHRPGYHDEQALASELSWMAALRQANLRVPAPVATPDGRHIVPLTTTPDFDAQHADIVSWMTGIPLGQSGVPLTHSPERLVAIFRALGETMARMHVATDAWAPPSSFHRPAWDGCGLLGERPLWGRFWDCAGLSPDQHKRLSDLRLLLRKQLDGLSSLDLDYGLIHADLVRENVLVDGNAIELIDFDDGGYGWRMFDIATALFKNRDEPHYALIETALIGGYTTVRPLPDWALKTLPLFTILRSLTYIGWIGARADTPDAAERLQRYASDTLALADTLGTRV
ncbi:phosphotransferase enzyme family protein [Rhizobium lusitanum]|jgi:Ser/Thr protein kinase RdoA (MazF antagonist)|uniref:phosphotransferase enzyme family protein n=1 Tax=Rhizobium lusitanum TaxID=293958 RepID=UPI000DD7B247|nr:phosphotransferase [Rhizobium lusitanum]NTJ09325.1 phosphotransferase [Rhizobium lusitanum]